MTCQKTFLVQKCLVQKSLGPKRFWEFRVQRDMEFEEILVKKSGSKRNCYLKNCPKISNQNKFWQNFWSREILVQKDLGSWKLGSKNESKRIRSKKFGLKKLFDPKKLDEKKI